MSTDRSAARWRRYLDAVNFDGAPRPLRAALEFAFVALRRFIAIEGAQQAIVLAAQAFTSLIPLMVVAAAASPGSEDSPTGSSSGSGSRATRPGACGSCSPAPARRRARSPGSAS